MKTVRRYLLVAMAFAAACSGGQSDTASTTAPGGASAVGGAGLAGASFGCAAGSAANSGLGGQGGAAAQGGGAAAAGGTSGTTSSGGAAGGGSPLGGAGISGGSGATGTAGAGGKPAVCDPPDVPGAPEAIGTADNVTTMVVDDTYLYWSEPGSVRAIPKAGGAVIVMLSAQNFDSSLNVLEPGWLHVSSQPTSTGATLYKLPAGVANGTPVTISKQLVYGTPLLKVGDNLYCDDAILLPPADSPFVRLDPLTGTVSMHHTASNVVTDGTNLFWRLEADYSWLEMHYMVGKIRKLPPGATQPVDLVDDGKTDNGEPRRIVANPLHICYSNRCYDPADGKVTAEIKTPYGISDILLDEPYLYILIGGVPCVSIWRAKTDGTKVEHFWDSPGNPSNFALDAEYVYWFDAKDLTFYRKHK